MIAYGCRLPVLGSRSRGNFIKSMGVKIGSYGKEEEIEKGAQIEEPLISN